MGSSIRELNANALANAQRYVVLALDEISLILAQREIQALEPVLDVRALPEDGGSYTNGDRPAGLLSLAEGDCPVYSLDGDLKSLRSIPSEHRICAIMNHRSRPYSLTCKEVRLLPSDALSVRQIPRPLQAVSASSPIASLVVSGGELLLGTSASALHAHLVRSIDAEIIPFDEHFRRVRK